MPTHWPTTTPSFRPTTSASPSVLPTKFPTEQPTLSRSTALGNVIGSYYPGGSYDFVEGTNQYAALELLANSDPVLVPVPDESSNSKYLLLQRYVLVLLYLNTNGDMKDQAGDVTCNWSGVTCSDGSLFEDLDRTYSTVKT
jgi:hypothetical protein